MIILARLILTARKLPDLAWSDRLAPTNDLLRYYR